MSSNELLWKGSTFLFKCCHVLQQFLRSVSYCPAVWGGFGDWEEASWISTLPSSSPCPLTTHGRCSTNTVAGETVPPVRITPSEKEREKNHVKAPNIKFLQKMKTGSSTPKEAFSVFTVTLVKYSLPVRHRSGHFTCSITFDPCNSFLLLIILNLRRRKRRHRKVK